jgi:transcriptional regulator with XRE-family HTH domain
MAEGITTQTRLREVVAEEIRALLGRRRMSGGALAAAIGKSEMYVSRRLRGETPFDIDDLDAIATALGVEPGKLLYPNGQVTAA